MPKINTQSIKLPNGQLLNLRPSKFTLAQNTVKTKTLRSRDIFKFVEDEDDTEFLVCEVSEGGFTYIDNEGFYHYHSRYNNIKDVILVGRLNNNWKRNNIPKVKSEIRVKDIPYKTVFSTSTAKNGLLYWKTSSGIVGLGVNCLATGDWSNFIVKRILGELEVS